MSAQVGESRVIPEWSLGDRLRKVRRVTGFSQAEFAERLGENQKTYAAWELDTSAPRNVVALAKKVEMISQVPAVWVLGMDADASTHRRATGGYPHREQAPLAAYPQLTAVPPLTGSHSVAPHTTPSVFAHADVTHRATPTRTSHLPRVA